MTRQTTNLSKGPGAVQNQRGRPFTWTKDADQILAKLKRQNASATDH